MDDESDLRGEKSKKIFLCLVEFLLSICLDAKGGLTSLLVGRGIDFDLVLCHDLLHDLTDRSGLAIPGATGEGERVGEDGLGGDGGPETGGDGCDAGGGGRDEGGEGRVGVGVELGGGRVGGERVGRSFEFMPVGHGRGQAGQVYRTWQHVYPTLCHVVPLMSPSRHLLPLLLAASTILATSPLLVRNDVHAILDHPPQKHPECTGIPVRVVSHPTSSPLTLPQPAGPIETTECDYETLESVNHDLFTNLSLLVRLPFFKYFQVLLLSFAYSPTPMRSSQVDLYRECPFWPDHGQCADPGCTITTVDEVQLSVFRIPLILILSLQSNIPEKWRSTTLSKLDSSSIEKASALLLSSPPLTILSSVMNYPDVITGTLTFVSWMIIRVEYPSSQMHLLSYHL